MKKALGDISFLFQRLDKYIFFSWKHFVAAADGDFRTPLTLAAAAPRFINLADDSFTSEIAAACCAQYI